MKKIPLLSLTLGQQGGIGYPPVIIKLDNQWYAISDSRKEKRPKELENILEYQRRLPKKSKYWHSQQFVMNKWIHAPKLTWNDVINKLGL